MIDVIFNFLKILFFFFIKKGVLHDIFEEIACL